MKSLSITLFFFLVSINLFGQINKEDSTVQVIAFWDKNEKQLYTVSSQKIKIEGSDTTITENYSYDVEITILDSTSNTYTIEWAYKNFKIDTENKFTKKLMSIADDSKVIFKTDEMGAFQEVINWQEVKDYIKKCTDLLKKEFNDVPKIDEILNQVNSMFLTKESIQSGTIQEIQQFYTYHGGKYKLGEELNGKMQMANLYGGEPFDTDVTVQLDEINFEDDNSILRSWQTVDSTQLTEETFKYLTKMASNMGIPPPKRDEIKTLHNDTRVSSLIHGASGWVIYSIETKEVSTEGIISVEERIIELK